MPIHKLEPVFLDKFACGARPDTVDFRDTMYNATLVEVPMRLELNDYKAYEVPVLDQGGEGACTGFGLATVANYLLRRRHVVPDERSVSPLMLYEMAKRYDEWPGEEYEGSSARGAMKGWNKHGVCSDKKWPFVTNSPDAFEGDGKDANSHLLTDERAIDASFRPLGAYYRVNHKDIVAMHSALAEVSIIFATARVHKGWSSPDSNGIIKYSKEVLGGHAFAIVAYNEHGFWIQNSWGTDWGLGGFALITYDDWLANASDVWVARLGVPFSLISGDAVATSRSAIAGQREGFSFQELRPHIISTGNQGSFKTFGTYASSEASVAAIFREDFPRITANWAKKRLLLYAHGGLVGESDVIQRLADYRQALLQAEVYPISFIWNSDFWSTLTDLLEDAVNIRRPEQAGGFLGGALDFMLDRFDDALEPLACALGGRKLWDEMKQNAQLATQQERGGVRIALKYLVELLKRDPDIELHLVGHSAGAIFHAPIIQLLTSEGDITSGPMQGRTGYGLKVASCTLWAPACTVDLFKQTYLPAIQNGSLESFTFFTLTDDSEQGDQCANIYHKSLLYLVSNAFEDRPRIPLFQENGEPLLGMEKFVLGDAELNTLFTPNSNSDIENNDGSGPGATEWVKAPNTEPVGSPWASTSHHHGDFDDDLPTVRATLARILRLPTLTTNIEFHHSASALQNRRRQLTK